MARKRNDQLSEKEKKFINKRVLEALEEYEDKHGSITQQDISNKTGISKSTINRMINSDSVDNYFTLSNLIKLSKFFNVSLDYLVGNTKSKRIDIEKRAISEKLNLSDKAIDNILKINKSSYKNDIQALNYFLESSYIEDFVANISYYFSSHNKLNGYLFYDENDEKETLDYLDDEDIKILLLEKIKKTIKNIYKEIEDINNGKKK